MMKLIKFSTFLVKITHKNTTSVSYQNYTDVSCRLYKHFIHPKAAFPYKDLEIGESYTLISAQVDVEGELIWLWWKAWHHGDPIEDAALVDPLLEEFVTQTSKEAL